MTTHDATQQRASYDLATVDQWSAERAPDLVPKDAAARQAIARLLATDAAIYGLPSVYQYTQMYEQAVDREHPSYTGFNRFAHQRDVTTPEFTAFRTPNVDTLYSNAWLDLTDGPCLVHIPPIGTRYYTLQFCDMYANASNLSSRTVGPDGGDFLVAQSTWDGEVPDGTRLFRVASPYMWILMRILVRDSPSDLDYVRGLQDEVTLRALGRVGAATFPATTRAAAELEWRSYFTVLDWTLRVGGHPIQEDAYASRFRMIDIGGPSPFAPADLDAERVRGIETGFDDAMEIIRASRAQVGEVGATGWATGTGGEPGFNYLRRAVQNFAGTGGNVVAEKRFFVTFNSSDGTPLDGSRSNYVIRFDSPPPVSGHWSLTLYPTATGLLYPNEIDRYAVSATTPGLEIAPDGSLTILVQHERPENIANWLPAPEEEFYIDLRNWEPDAPIRDGSWLPGPVVEVHR